MARPLTHSHGEDSHVLQCASIPISGQFYLVCASPSGSKELNDFVLLFHYYFLLLKMYHKLSGSKWHPFIIPEFSRVRSHRVGGNLLQQPTVGQSAKPPTEDKNRETTKRAELSLLILEPALCQQLHEQK